MQGPVVAGPVAVRALPGQFSEVGILREEIRQARLHSRAGGERCPRERLNVGADLDDVLAEELHHERGDPRLVGLQQRAERPLADKAVVVPRVDSRGYDLFRAAQPAGDVRGGTGV